MSRGVGRGLLLAVAATLVWLGFGLANGPAQGNDTRSYARVADALAEGRIVTSIRSPGYPLFVVATRRLARLLDTEPAHTLLVVQTALLAGVGTALVCALGERLAGGRTAGIAAAVLYAGDADLQQFASTALPEALAVLLAIVGGWLRVRDGGWRRAAWPIALLAIVHPRFLGLPLAFAAVAGWRRPAAAVGILGPSAVLLGTWAALSLASGADPLRPQRYFLPLDAFGKIYEAGLWQRLPDGPERRLIATARARGDDPYQAAAALRARGGDATVLRVARSAARADPLGYARAVAAIPRHAFKQGTFMRPELMQPEHPSPGWLAATGAWRRAYRRIFYASFPLFVVLLGLACWNGLGWPAAVAPLRAFVGPFVVGLLATVALGSLSTYDVGRLALPVHPFYCLEWGLVAGWVAARLRGHAR
ncbi:MAG TPA: hypothetical protein VKW76_06005 [Candidatus Binatia bacterium]|nr:hypothetical protein [Candidatus Binatia bacterium]